LEALVSAHLGGCDAFQGPADITAGDILALSKLVTQIARQLKSVPESAPDYQLVVQEIDALERALNSVYSIQHGAHELKRLDAIRALSSSCLLPLQQFSDKIANFDKSLGIWTQRRQRWNGVGRAIHWSFMWKDEIAKLRAVLTPKLFTLLILLSSQIAESNTESDIDQAAFAHKTTDELSLQHVILEQISQSQVNAQSEARSQHGIILTQLQSQEHALDHLDQKLQQIHRQGTDLADRLDDQSSQLQTISDEVATVYQETALVKSETRAIFDFMQKMVRIAGQRWSRLLDIAQLIHDLLRLSVELTKESLYNMQRLLREFGELRQQLTFLQRYLPLTMPYPMISFRDAYNVLRPFPYDTFRQWEGAKRMVSALFVNRAAGLRRVERGQWFVTHVGRGVRLMPQHWERAIQPGDELSMTMVLDDVVAEEGRCPFPSCGADTSNVGLVRGGRYCPNCFRFSRISPGHGTEAPVEELEDGEQLIASKAEQTEGPGENAKGRPPTKAEDEVVSQLPELPEAPQPESAGMDDIEEYYYVQVVRMVPAITIEEPQVPDQTVSMIESGSGSDVPTTTAEITIFVTGLENETLCIRVASSATIHEVKKIIRKRKDIPVKRQRMTFGGKKLEYSKTLAESGIQDMNTIHCIQQPSRMSEPAFNAQASMDAVLSTSSKLQATSDGTDGSIAEVVDVASNNDTVVNTSSMAATDGSVYEFVTKKTSTQRRTSQTRSSRPSYYDTVRYDSGAFPYYGPPPSRESEYSSGLGAPRRTATARPRRPSTSTTRPGTYYYTNSYDEVDGIPSYYEQTRGDGLASPHGYYSYDQPPSSYAPYGRPLARYESGNYTRSNRNAASFSAYQSGSSYYYEREPAYQRPPSGRNIHTSRRTAPTRRTAPKVSTGATEADAGRHGIPPGYSLKNWDPSEEPILLLGSVFDANSLGKWIYDWTVYRHSPQHPMADMAGELWLLLIKLAGKMKRADQTLTRIRNVESRELVEEFLESGDRLWTKFEKILKSCETYMWKTFRVTTNETKTIKSEIAKQVESPAKSLNKEGSSTETTSGQKDTSSTNSQEHEAPPKDEVSNQDQAVSATDGLSSQNTRVAVEEQSGTHDEPQAEVQQTSGNDVEVKPVTGPITLPATPGGMESSDKPTQTANSASASAVVEEHSVPSDQAEFSFTITPTEKPTSTIPKARKAQAQMGKASGIEFVDSIFGRDRLLEDTEKIMSSMRLWNMRFDVNCEEILRTPAA
jgi:hypothetical protein